MSTFSRFINPVTLFVPLKRWNYPKEVFIHPLCQTHGIVYEGNVDKQLNPDKILHIQWLSRENSKFSDKIQIDLEGKKKTLLINLTENKGTIIIVKQFSLIKKFDH